jgi:hypothetical protein
MADKKEVEHTIEHEHKNKSVVVTFRIFQAIFYGIFALGVSMAFGDYSAYIKSPIGQLSITLVVFGMIGAGVTGMLSKQAEKW